MNFLFYLVAILLGLCVFSVQGNLKTPETTNLTLSDDTCVDLHDSCEFWYQQGDCKNENEAFMRKHCRYSCKFCDKDNKGEETTTTAATPTPTEESTTAPTVPCIDRIAADHCQYLERLGYCNSEVLDILRYMERVCAKTCRICAPEISTDNQCGSPIVPLIYRTTQARVINGTNALYGSIPWQVDIRIFSDIQWCGGSLINNQYVVTAAHCVATGLTLDKMFAYLGKHNLDATKIDEGQLKVNFSSSVVHPDYNPLNYDNDIAVLKLSAPVEFTDFIKPVCLPSQGEVITPGTLALVSGFGDTLGSASNAILQQVDLEVISTTDCVELHSDLPVPIDITENMFCAGYAEGQKDACQGDSGGPLVIQQDGRHVLVGIVSSGLGCALPNRPGIYTKVSDKVVWINDNIIE